MAQIVTIEQEHTNTPPAPNEVLVVTDPSPILRLPVKYTRRWSAFSILVMERPLRLAILHGREGFTEFKAYWYTLTAERDGSNQFRLRIGLHGRLTAGSLLTFLFPIPDEWIIGSRIYRQEDERGSQNYPLARINKRFFDLLTNWIPNLWTKKQSPIKYEWASSAVYIIDIFNRRWLVYQGVLQSIPWLAKIKVEGDLGGGRKEDTFQGKDPDALQAYIEATAEAVKAGQGPLARSLNTLAKKVVTLSANTDEALEDQREQIRQLVEAIDTLRQGQVKITHDTAEQIQDFLTGLRGIFENSSSTQFKAALLTSQIGMLDKIIEGIQRELDAIPDEEAAARAITQKQLDLMEGTRQRLQDELSKLTSDP